MSSDSPQEPQSADPQSIDAQSTDAQSTDAQSSDAQSSDAQSIENSVQTTGEQSSPLRSIPLPFRLREILGILAVIVAADFLIYRGHGYFGFAAMLVVVPLILGTASRGVRFHISVWVSASVLVLFALRMSWHANPLRVTCALFSITCLAHAAHRNSLVLREVMWFPVQIFPAGVSAIFRHISDLRFSFGGRSSKFLLSIVIPMGALFVFGSIFVLANPDAVTFVQKQFQSVMEFLDAWLRNFSLPFSEVTLWFLAAILTAGFLRPQLLPKEPPTDTPDPHEKPEPQASPLYPAFRNTLLSVIVLFSVYMVYEFSTLWFREFPEGFYYAGYAHEGAFWLTVALGLASAVLSFMFRGTILNDSRYESLRRLAWIWCLLNGLLVFAVYNRLFIYVGFNGLTHLRIVGLFGISSVVAGFALVIFKIAKHQTFLWLLSRQIGALIITIMLYAFCPVDYIAVSYNTNRILAGDSTAVMQIGVQDIDVEGVLVLPRLLECEDSEIRAGVRALMAKHYVQLKRLQDERNRLGWTTYQFGDQYTLRSLEQWKSEWSEYEDEGAREAALKKFYDYAYQWY